MAGPVLVLKGSWGTTFVLIMKSTTLGEPTEPSVPSPLRLTCAVGMVIGTLVSGEPCAGD